MQLGAHTVTLGTHNEIFDFRNLFIQNSFGFYTFTNVENFEAGLAQAYAYSYSNTADPLQAADFGVRQYSLYAGDQWRVAPDADADVRTPPRRAHVSGYAGPEPGDRARCSAFART